ncbi:hypothetical protein ACQZV8_11065 [Magnetococcales bacterium HHB-1]
MSQDHWIWFAHGKKGIPWGGKIKALAQIGRSFGYQIESPDYTITEHADQRVEMFYNRFKKRPKGRLILVGSSMGSYLSIVVSKKIKPDALFLLAPAIYLPGYQHQDPTPVAQRTVVIHGWQDQTVPFENAVKFSTKHQTELLMLNSDHRLLSAMPEIKTHFSHLLEEMQ